MPRWLKITIGISASIIILLMVGGFIFYRMLASSVPDYEGQITTDNISAKVEIYRDSSGIPCIIASAENDAAFALGYLHAEERIFQMDIMRRAGEGRLSEIFGQSTVAFDKMFLTIGIKKTAEENLKRINPAVLKLLSSYTDGVNLYLQEAKGNYPVEFDVLNYDPYEWKPEHSLIIIRMLAYELNISWWTDLAFIDLIRKVGEEKFLDIMPDYPDDLPAIIPPEVKKLKNTGMDLIKTSRDFRDFIGVSGTHLGSNNWVVNGKKADGGKPVIANDPHLSYSVPCKWYAAVIRSPEWNADGVTLPGAPAVVIGKNSYPSGSISWAVTNIMLDDTDFYVEKIDSAGKNYLVNDKWRNLKIKKALIRVKDSADAAFEIKYTHRGPVISDIHPYTGLFPDKKIKQPAVSMKWAGNDPSDELYAYYLLNRAKNWDEFRKALGYFSIPGQNFIYGDSKGNIGYVFGGKIPLRKADSPTLLFDGTTDKYDWNNYVPADQLPVLFNPPENFIATANNKVIENFKYHISNLWEPSSRIERITELLKSKEKHSVDDYMRYQNDIISPYARKVTGHILTSFEETKITDNNLRFALELIEDWNFEMDEFSQVPSIYAYFLKHLMENIYLDEMGPDLFNEFIFVGSTAYRSTLKILERGSGWFDNVSTRRTETKESIIRKSFSDALNTLETRLGADITQWQWGKLHRVVIKHQFSGYSPLLDEYINIGPEAIGGDGTTLFNTEYPFNEGVKDYSQSDIEPFQNNLGPSMRFIYDFSRPDEFYLITNTGQSGNIFSDHYEDMFDNWLYGKYLKIRTDAQSLKKNKKLLEIIPVE